MNIRWQVHFSASLLLAFYMLSGRFAEYVIIVLSLLIHEIGHLIAARFAHVRIESVCFYMYGADMRFQTNLISPSQQFVIASGGPLATLFVLVFCLVASDGSFAQVIQMQKLLLLINLCPIWPLDGGRILQSIIVNFSMHRNEQMLFLKFSFVVAAVTFVLAIVFLKPFVILLFAVVCKQIGDEIRQFPLRRAYKQLVLNEK